MGWHFICPIMLARSRPMARLCLERSGRGEGETLVGERMIEREFGCVEFHFSGVSSVAIKGIIENRETEAFLVS